MISENERFSLHKNEDLYVHIPPAYLSTTMKGKVNIFI